MAIPGIQRPLSGAKPCRSGCLPDGMPGILYQMLNPGFEWVSGAPFGVSFSRVRVGSCGSMIRRLKLSGASIPLISLAPFSEDPLKSAPDLLIYKRSTSSHH